MTRPGKALRFIPTFVLLHSFHFPGLPMEKQLFFFFSPKKKEEAQIKNERIQKNPQFLTHVNLTVSSTTHTSASTRHPPNSTFAEDTGSCY